MKSICIKVSLFWVLILNLNWAIAEGAQVSGYFGMDLGDLVESNSIPDTIYHEWVYSLLGGVTIENNPLENLFLKLTLEAQSYQIYPREKVSKNQDGTGAQRSIQWDTYLDEAQLLYKLGDSEKPAWEIEGGYFAYKYNSDSKVLGEYLFRSMIYPTVAFTKFNSPYSKIFGIRLGHRIGESFHHDIIVQSEVERFHEPYYDFSLGYVAHYNFANIFELGGGFKYRSLLPVRPSKTTPKGKSTTFYRLPPQNIIYDNFGAPDTVQITEAVSMDIDGLGAMNLTVLDTNSVEVIRSEVLINETTHLTFAGAILMGRFSINPFGFWDEPLLGKDAFKFYAEAAVLGWKNYEPTYNERRERIPIMFGIHFPSFNLLDAVGLEFEYLPLDTMVSFGRRASEFVPLPGPRTIGAKEGFCNNAMDNSQGVATPVKGNRCREDDWKWMLYARKEFSGGFGFVLQLGSDHMKRFTLGDQQYDDIFTRHEEWYWQLRFISSIK